MKNLIFFRMLIVFAILLFADNALSQSQRILNTDTLIYQNNTWNYKRNGSGLLTFDSTMMIVRFNEDVNRDVIIAFLRNNNIELIDSLYEYKLCKLNSSYTFSRNIDSLSSNNFFNSYAINHPAFLDNYPNDFYFNLQNHIYYGSSTGAELNLAVPWTKTVGNPEIVVAVIDAFPNWSHEDIGNLNDFLIDNIYENEGEDVWSDINDPSSGDKIDNDNNGFIDDWRGWNFNNNTNDTRSIYSDDVHGTNVMGVIAAKSNNSIGVVGIAGGDYADEVYYSLGVRMLPINIFSSTLNNSQGVSTNEWNLAQAIEYAAKQRVNVIALSMSFRTAQVGTSFTIPIVEKALDMARNKYGCLIFCSAGNTGSTIDYPGYNSNVHAIGGLIYQNGNLFNNFRKGDYQNGKVLSFVALAENIGTTTTSTISPYTNDFGQTSAASPQASGVAALLLSYNTCLTNTLIFEIMKSSANIYVTSDQSSFIHDNNTNSNLFGYGMLNAEGAMDLIDAYTITNYTINSNTTWSTSKIANQDIIITSGNTLTVTGYLNMTENTKIIVQAGANLIINSGEITGACGWEGIKVYGIANQAQNATTFGEVRIINNAKLSYARIAVESINGGIIVTNTDATYRNNRSSIVINKHKYDNLFTIINDSHFISDGPFLSKSNKINKVIEGIKEFINLNGTQLISISNCTFENTSELKYTQAANAINAYSTNFTQISNCEFSGMFRAIDVVAYNGLLNTVKIYNSVFNNNVQGIRVVNSTIDIFDNEFNLPQLNTKLNTLFANNSIYGIYTFGSVNDIRNNNISTTVETSAALGIIVRNSRKIYKSFVEYNHFSNLSIGTQIEQYNKQLQISCNDYSNINKHAWSLNPQFTSGSGIFPMQGSLISGTNQKRAGNLFYDRDLPSNSLRHIKSSFEFIYNAANSPADAVPEYVSTDVIVNTFGELNSQSCIGGAFQLILCNDEPCIFDELDYLLSITIDEDSLIRIKQAILKHLLDNQNYGQAIDYLEVWNTDQANLEFLFETLLSNEENESATSVLESFSVVDQRDQDYFDFYSILLNQLNEEIPADSLTSYELGIIQDIASRNNDVSDMAKAYLNYFSLDYHALEPEEWEEESLRITNKSETKNSKKPIIETPKFNVSIFPNPMAEQFSLFISSTNTKELFKLEITNTLGQNVLNQDQLIANSKTKIDVSTLTTGVFYIKITNAVGEKSVKRISIVR